MSQHRLWGCRGSRRPLRRAPSGPACRPPPHRHRPAPTESSHRADASDPRPLRQPDTAAAPPWSCGHTEGSGHALRLLTGFGQTRGTAQYGSGPHVCILRAPTRPKANAAGSWPQRVGGLTQPRGRCGHEGGLGVTGKGRGRISKGPPTLHIPLAASGESTSVPRPPCPICDRVSRPPLGSQRALPPTSSLHCVLLPFCYFAFQSEDALASPWLPMEAQSAKSGSPGLPPHGANTHPCYHGDRAWRGPGRRGSHSEGTCLELPPMPCSRDRGLMARTGLGGPARGGGKEGVTPTNAAEEGAGRVLGSMFCFTRSSGVRRKVQICPSG